MKLPGGVQRALGKRLQSLRGRLLAGGLVIVFVLWMSDLLSHYPSPLAAKAAGPLTIAQLVPDPPDRAALDAFLACVETVRLPVALAGLRDPFARTASTVPAVPIVNAAPLELVEVNESSRMPESPHATTPFEHSHRLQGVVLGERPFAMIDGKSYRVGDRIDGYRILSIERERVTLQGIDCRATLRLSRPNLEQKPGTP